MSRFMSSIALVGLVLLMTCATAQDPRGTIPCRVTDWRGAAAARANETDNFVMPHFLTGNDVLSSELSRFKKFALPDMKHGRK
jgi:hypothetical protein